MMNKNTTDMGIAGAPADERHLRGPYAPREPGPKGLGTRQALIDAAIQLVGCKSLRDISVADIATAAGTSKATFYTYFANVPAVLLAASSELSQSTPEVMQVAQLKWTRDNCRELSLQLVRAYVKFWSEHRALLRARNLAAEEGVPDFVSARARAVRPLLEELTRKFAEAQAEGNVDSAALPYASAATLLMMLERLGALSPSLHDKAPADHEDLIRSAATMIRTSLGW